ncbi:hypothetical protein QAD02_021205, partial [Eretmocerus hayati]
LVLKKVSSLLPRKPVKSNRDRSYLEGLDLADPHCGVPSRVDVILNSGVLGAAILPGVRKAKDPLTSPIAQKTVNGWVLIGNTEPDDLTDGVVAMHHISVDNALTEAVARFWETEELPKISQYSPQDQECLDHFKRTCYRNAQGRWRLNSQLVLEDRRHGSIPASELNLGSHTLYQLVQEDAFPGDYRDLCSKGNVSSQSSLQKLLPFIDTNGLIRVGGRLQNSFLTESEKHPIILPKNHHVTVLLIRKAHACTLHGRYRLVHSHLFQKFWIIQASSTIRRIVRECTICTRHNAITMEQQMGPLPAIRTRPARPFAHYGVDFAGHFWIKASQGREMKSFKGYVAIFVCLVVKAIHLELVSDLTTTAFLTALRRFAARRGMCGVMYSDNATTYEGGENRTTSSVQWNVCLGPGSCCLSCS